MDDVLRHNPRIGGLVDADKAQSHIGCSGQRLQQRDRSGHIECPHQPERQRLACGWFSEQIPRRVGVIDDATGNRIELLGRQRRCDVLLVPDEQRRTEFGFEVGDGRRDRWLGNEAAPGRRCQVAFPDTAAK
jgi:hypothetical protein